MSVMYTNDGVYFTSVSILYFCPWKFFRSNLSWSVPFFFFLAFQIFYSIIFKYQHWWISLAFNGANRCFALHCLTHGTCVDMINASDYLGIELDPCCRWWWRPEGRAEAHWSTVSSGLGHILRFSGGKPVQNSLWVESTWRLWCWDCSYLQRFWELGWKAQNRA